MTIDWSKTAILFPGQGSQMVGMGAEVARTFPVAMRVFERADALLGRPFSALCFEGDEAILNQTENTQPALYVTSLALWAVLKEEMPDFQVGFMAGHSLGEFTALTASDALSFEDGLRLVAKRGELMRDAGKNAPGAMAAILGLDANTVREVCQQASAQTGGVLVLANDNCPGQVVVSGDNQTVELGLTLLTQAGAKRAVKLSVSVAAHSPLMASASSELVKAIESTPFQAPAVPIIANVSAKPLNTVMDIRLELADQLTQSVRWTESIEAMVKQGCEHFIEVGSGEVLTGLVKRVSRSAQRTNLHSADSVRAFIEMAQS